MLPVRKPRVVISYEGTELVGHVGADLLSLNYTDNAYDKADDLQVSFQDRDGRWRQSWAPRTAGIIEASIVAENWYGPGATAELPCGKFQVDEISYSGPPDVVRIKGSSAHCGTSIRGQQRTHGYKNQSLRKIVETCAGRHGYSVHWEGDDVEFKRIDQRQESDLHFLQRLTRAYGFQLKLSDDQLICVAGVCIDGKDAVKTFTRGEDNIVRYSFRKKGVKIFRDCKASYYDPEAKKNREARHEDPGKDKGPTLRINERMESG